MQTTADHKPYGRHVSINKTGRSLQLLHKAEDNARWHRLHDIKVI